MNTSAENLRNDSFRNDSVQMGFCAIYSYKVIVFDVQENPRNPCASCVVFLGPMIVPMRKSKIAAMMMAIRKF